eukprot:s2379_g4.t2
MPGRIMGHVEEMFPEAREFSSSTKSKILDEIFLQLELSRELLERHAQGLIGTDLAELKMMKAEYKRLDDRLVRMNKLFAKEVSSLRDLLQKKKEGVTPAPPKSSYEPLMFMEPAQRGWLLGLLEEKLEALRTIFQLLWTSLTGLLHCIMHLHFLLGAVAAFAVMAAASWQVCMEAGLPQLATDPRTMLQRVVLILLRAFALSVLQQEGSRRSANGELNWAWLTNIVTELEHRVAQLLLRGQCPYRTPEEAREACLSRSDSLILRRASDCSTLRRAYYDGQKQVHPDRLRLLHPACDTEVLQACSALLEANPDIERRVNAAELARLRDLFKKEQQSSLERKVAKLNEEDQAARKQIAVLEAYNEKLKLEIRKIDDSGSSTSTLDGLAPEGSASLLVVKQTSGSSAAMSPPAGKPKTGRPKRGATFTRAGSGEESAAQAAMPDFLQLPEGS